jgi:hypothetical protein
VADDDQEIDAEEEEIDPVDEADETAVPSDPNEEESFPENRFNISSYGWDSDVEGLVKRLKRQDIHVPRFQRGFVWTNTQKSRFIESLVMGLPVPNVFLAQDGKTRNLNIVDGQQRLLSLRDYLEGKFSLRGEHLQDDLKGRYFSAEVAPSKRSKVLEIADARALADAVIHSIVIKPDPSDDDPSRGHEYNQAVIQIFRRLNTSAQPLVAQEIRTSIFYGSLDSLIRELNQDENWRTIFGKPHSRLKDMELILRSISLIENGDNYKAAMPRFLDNYMEANREMSPDKVQKIRDNFKLVTSAIVNSIGRDGLRNGTNFVLTKLDAVMVGYSEYLKKYSTVDHADLIKRVGELESDTGDLTSYQWAVSEFVNDTDRVLTRVRRARQIIGA